jgi:hypothetical protein
LGLLLTWLCAARVAATQFTSESYARLLALASVLNFEVQVRARAGSNASVSAWFGVGRLAFLCDNPVVIPRAGCALVCGRSR